MLALAALLAASGCGPREPSYGAVHNAALSADGKTLLVLVEHGTEITATSSNPWRGDITTQFPESMRIHEFDRSSGKAGRVLVHPPPASPGGRELLENYPSESGTRAKTLKDCREAYTECAATTTPHPYMLGRRVVDPEGRRMIEWNGRQLVVTPFEALTATQIRDARGALFRRAAERMRAAALVSFAARAASEDPERILTTTAGTAETDPGLTASYQLMPGRVVFSRFGYAEERFFVVWERDGACVTDNAEVAALVGCHASDEGGVRRASSGIARARPPDPDRLARSWGVVATRDRPETPSGTVTVACHGMPRETSGRSCSQHDGNTECRTSLPMLCSKADASLPAQSPWARRLALTTPIKGTELVSLDAADHVCRTQLGDGWRMTEANELGYKYTVTGVGSLPTTSRFWVREGEGLTNCW
jgi:hypothetical protein